MSTFNKCLILLLFILSLTNSLGVQAQLSYWNKQTTLQPRRLPLPDDLIKIIRIDLDKDGDPDVLKYTIIGGIPVMWVDDDDNMKWTD